MKTGKGGPGSSFWQFLADVIKVWSIARSVGPILKFRKPLERELYAFSYESNLTHAILNISKIMSLKMKAGIVYLLRVI